MSSQRVSVYLLVWVLTPLVNALAEKTWYPNQIIVGYELFQVGLGMVLLRNFTKILLLQARWIFVLLLYSGTFIVVSYYGVDFATSVKYFVLYEPILIVLPFIIAFSIGYVYPEERTFKYLMAVGPLIVLETLLEMSLSPEQPRFVSTLTIPMVIPLYVFFGYALLALVCMLILLMSLKKTIVAVGLLSLALAYLLKEFIRRGETPLRGLSVRRSLATTVGMSVILLSAAGFMLLQYSSLLTDTIGRFAESEDVSRAAISYYSLVLLAQHFPWGIGWMGFLFLSIGVIPYSTANQRGQVFIGANLHNSYMTWALEGGVPILLIVLYLFWNLLATIRSFLRRRMLRLLGATLLIWLIGGAIFGAFQQWHMTDTFWQLFGFAFGCGARYRTAHEVEYPAPHSHA